MEDKTKALYEIVGGKLLNALNPKLANFDRFIAPKYAKASNSAYFEAIGFRI